jgi:hypothetical protein
MFFSSSKVKASTLHTFFTVAWALLAIPTLFYWRESVLWVALMSLWANIASHWAAREAAKVKENQEEAAEPQ